jgi:AraC-like DNA-binding protein
MNAKNPKLAKLNLLIEKHTPNEGPGIFHRKLIGVTRESRLHKKEPQIYPSGIVVVGQGGKSCYVGDQAFNYAAGGVLVTMLPIPVETEVTQASADKPFLAAAVGIDFARLADVLLKIEQADPDAFQPIQANPSSIFSTTAKDKLIDAFIRLLEALEDTRDTEVLSDAIIDEIYYRILVDERNGELRYLLQQRGEIQRVSKAVEHIHNNLDQTVSVEELAGLVHMSRSAFFDKFKDVMHASPLQYAKSVKLHQAQVLIQQGKKANEAAFLVGYNSTAQFSREYKRFFGFVPSETQHLTSVGNEIRH